MNIAYDEICRCKPTVCKKVEVKIDTPFLRGGSTFPKHVCSISLNWNDTHTGGTWELLEGMTFDEIVSAVANNEPIYITTQYDRYLLTHAGYTAGSNTVDSLEFVEGQIIYCLYFDNDNGGSFYINAIGYSNWEASIGDIGYIEGRTHYIEDGEVHKLDNMYLNLDTATDTESDNPVTNGAVSNALHDVNLLDGTWESIADLGSIRDYRVIKVFDVDPDTEHITGDVEHVLFCSGWTGNELLYGSDDGLHCLAFDNRYNTYTYDEEPIDDTSAFAKRVYVYEPLYHNVSVTDDGNGTVTLSIK